MVEKIKLDKKCPKCGGTLIGTSKTVQEHKNGVENPPYVENWMIIKCENCDFEEEELLNSEQY